MPKRLPALPCLPPFLSPLQRHHPGEHSHRQPWGSQQPLHPHRPSEQLLSSPGLASDIPPPHPHALAEVRFRQRGPSRTGGAHAPSFAGPKGRNNPEKFQGCGGEGSPPHTPAITGPEEAAVTSHSAQAAQGSVGAGPGQSIPFCSTFPFHSSCQDPAPAPCPGNIVFKRENYIGIKAGLILFHWSFWVEES